MAFPCQKILKKKSFLQVLTYFLLTLFYIHWQFTREQGKGRDHLYFSVPLPLAHGYSDICLMFNVKWLRRIFSRIASNHQTVGQWDLPLIGITIWLIDDEMLIYLHDYLILDFLTTIWQGEAVDLNSHRLSLYYNKQTYKPSALVERKLD